MRWARHWAGFLAALALLFGATAAAQDDRSAAIEAARAEYADIRAALDAREIENAGAVEARLRTLRDESRQRLAAVERELAIARAQLAPLGPAPGDADPPEGEELAAQRAELNGALARLASESTLVKANIFEANDLLTRLSASQIQTLYERLLARGPSPLAPASWRPAGASAAAVAGAVSNYFRSWSVRKETGGAFWPAVAFIALALLISILLFGPADRWIAASFAHAIEKRKASPARRVVAAGLKMMGRAIPGLIGGFIVLETLRAQGVITEAGAPAARALWASLIAYLLVIGFLRGLFAPANPAWRIAPVEASRGRRLSALIIVIVLVFGVKSVLTEILEAANGAPELTRLVQAAGAIAIGALLYVICRRRQWRRAERAEDAEKETDRAQGESAADRDGWWRLARRSGRAIAILIAAAALAGYVALADFAVSRLYYLALFLALAWFVRALLKESARWLRRRLLLRAGPDDDDENGHRAENFLFWTGVVINFALFLALLPGLLVLFGVPASNVRDLAVQSLFGFTVGGVRIPSIANFAIAIAIFIAILAATRLAQRGFEKGPFAHSHIDPGVQNSLVTLIGYAGLVVAAFASVSAMGFDLSNLALIAGALSVGIGFGLQSIVNNFVSGLILLFERPIKVGDWIVTPSGEGTVKKISVRSTEIETWDRASIIVPNSELVSSTVTNWTHKNKIGRITVPVGVSYNSDPEQVKTILLKCAQDHPMIVAYPEPFVTWMDFGASSLDFEIRAYLADISKGLTVRTELRFAIFKALKEAGVEIPFPQRDVHVKSLPDGLAPAALRRGDA